MAGERDIDHHHLATLIEKIPFFSKKGRKAIKKIVYGSMAHQLQLESISNEELLRRLSKLLQQSRWAESELVAHIGEVDRRRLYARVASPSMFAYCTEVLHLSESEAYLRILVGRSAREHPILLMMLGDGRLHLSGITKLAAHLTEANRDTLLARAVHKTKRQIEELIAELAPRPDVAAKIRKLPERRDKIEPTPPSQQRPDVVVLPPAPPPQKPAVVEPLAPARFKVAFTASVELRDKLARLRVLMRSSVPDGDLAAIIEEAVTEKLERIEARRFGKTNAPRKSLEETDLSPSSRYIPAAVKRAVRERDGDRCRFVDKQGRRCSERDELEFHHLRPFGRGGDNSPQNIKLMCPAHNGYHAERDYGKEVMERYRRPPGGVSEPAPIYRLGNQDAPDLAEATRSFGEIRIALNPTIYYISYDMKLISVTVSHSDYEAFREASKKQHRSIAQLIREAMAFYREQKLQQTTPLTELPVLPGHRLIGSLPSRGEVYEEIFEDER